MTKKILILGVLIVMAFSLAACGGNKYNAVMYDDAGKWMHEEFLTENLTRGAFYEDVLLDDNSYPKSIPHLIKNKEEFDSVFAEFPSEIDFKQSMICIYIFTCNYMGRPYEIRKIGKDNQILKIDVNFVRIKGCAARGYATKPARRCLVVKMDKQDITAVEFTEK